MDLINVHINISWIHKMDLINVHINILWMYNQWMVCELIKTGLYPMNINQFHITDLLLLYEKFRNEVTINHTP